MAKKKTPAKYEPNERDKEIAAKQLERRKTLNPNITVVADSQLDVAHEDRQIGYLTLMECCGTANSSFFGTLLDQLANATGKGKAINEGQLNFALAVIADIKPKDQIEAMLAAQMACVHIASMTFARRMNHTETIAQQDSAEKAYNKLLRTFTSQMKALCKYRTGGEQKVTVHHVQVNEGGQAIVGNVNSGGVVPKTDINPMHLGKGAVIWGIMPH